MTTPEEIERTRQIGEDSIMSHRAPEPESRATKRDMVKIVLVGVVVAVCLGTVIAVVLGVNAVSGVAQLEARDAARSELDQKDHELAQDAYDEAQAANRELRRRGEKPVAVPQPGEASNADVIANAAVPIVLEKLNEQGVSATGIAAQVASYIRSNPQGPSKQTLAALIAEHYRQNPPRDGEDGRDAPPITANQILVAVNAHCAQQPGGTCEGPMGPTGATGARGDTGAKGDPGTPAPVPVQTEFVVNEETGECEFVTTYRRADDTTYTLAAVTRETNCVP